MTGGSLGSSFYKPAIAPSTYQEPGYSRLPDNANQTLVNDTVYLNDPTFALPNRSQIRRRAFQNLQNSYYRQILYGCTNPHCQTPTCLSRQKRVSKGPFRPYTALSARALATVLASEDHPDDGLCPHQPVNSQAVSGPDPFRKDTKLAQKVKRKSGNPPQSPTSSPIKHAFSSGDTGTSILISTPKHVANGHIKTASPEQRHVKPEATVDFSDKQRIGDQSHKAKDPKSFAQCLFDTAAMKCMQLAEIPDGYLSWMRWISRVRRNTVSAQGDKLNAFVVNDQSRHDTDKLAKQGSGNSRVLLSSSEKPKELTQVSPPEQAAVHLDPALSSLDSSDNAKAKHSPWDLELQTASGTARDTSNGGLMGSRANPKSAAQRDALQRTDDIAAAEVTTVEPFSRHKTRNTLQTTSDEDEYTEDPRPQSLSRFTADNIQALEDTIVQNHSDLYEAHRRLRMRGRTDTPLRPSTCSRDEAASYQRFLAYSAQSVTYVLSNPEALLRSFVHSEIDDSSSKIVRSYALPSMVRSFRQLRAFTFPPLSILPSLWTSAGYVYPDRYSRKTNLAAETGTLAFRSDVEACHIAKVIFAALIASVPECPGRAWSALSKLRAIGQVAPLTDGSIADQKLVRMVLSTGAVFENEMALSVVTRLVRAIAARHFDIKFEKDHGENSVNYIAYILRYIASESFKVLVADNDAPLPSIKAGMLNMEDGIQVSEGLEKPFKVMTEWLRSVIMKEWDGKPQVPKNGAVGCALELLLNIQYYCPWFDSEPEIFYTPFLSERLDAMEMPPEWLDSDADGTSVHLLAYPFLFPPSVLVTYFRAINHAAMYKGFERAAMAEHLARRMTFTDPHSGRGAIRLQDRLEVAQNNFLVLEISRKDVLTDAMNQLWRRQKRELMRPLKVRMGMEEGEEGVDHGGVQQEFFRVAIAEAMDPKYGAFTTDTTTQMSWFQPGSLEPLYKFRLLGLVTSLAVYNGLTLPFTFPRALYRKLLDMPVTSLVDIEDGWPELTKGLRILRDWPEDNVEDVFMRPYVFSVDVFGATVDVDMDRFRKIHYRRMERANRWRERKSKDPRTRPSSREASSAKDKNGNSSSPDEVKKNVAKDSKAVRAPPTSAEKGKRDTHSSSSDYSSGEDEAFHVYRPVSPSQSPRTNPYGPDFEPIMVTNANRDEYIHDYIVHLTHFTVDPQWREFAAGFFTCINKKSISLFTPSTLKALVEGLPDIDVGGLEHVTRYEGGYHHEHPTIGHFWRVVRSWSQEKVRKLLEFVTSSDRLPVGGVDRLVFVVQKNGTGNERLPSSSTCFGRLLLPEYDSEGKLREGLETAVEYSKGFGQP